MTLARNSARVLLDTLKNISARKGFDQAVIFLGSLTFLLIRLSRISSTIFDEFFYAGESSRLFEAGTTLLSHPPVGKYLIKLGISALGYNPWGWRIFPALFGALSILALYELGVTLFQSRRAGALVAALSLVNGMIYVLSRAGMLDILMLGFSLWGWVIYLRYREKKWIFAGILFGLAVATKWSAALSLLGFIAIEWRRVRTLLPPVSLLKTSAVAAFVYVLAYAPLIGFRPEIQSPSSFVSDQTQIIRNHVNYAKPHVYLSTPSQWPLLLRPQWLFFEEDYDAGIANGVFLLGNPVIFILGFIAVLGCIFIFFRNKDRLAGLIAFLFLLHWLPYFLSPRKSLFFHYYLTASCFLVPAIVFWLRRVRLSAQIAFLALATTVFIYFLPLYGWRPFTPEEYSRRIWTDRWI